MAKCDICEHWASQLSAGLCPECKTKYDPDPTTVIGIAGPARCGKDTTAGYIVELFPQFDKMSFADPIKDMLRIGLGLSYEQLFGGIEKEQNDERYECSPRHLMQTLGTEWGRQMIHGDIWVNAMASRVDGHNVIIPDVRFDNEADFIRERGVLVHIVGRGGIGGDHKSESGVAIKDGDLLLKNDGSVEQLQEAIRCLSLIKS